MKSRTINHLPSRTMSKNIILCLDGTSDEVNSSPSNVLRLFHCLEQSDQQTIRYEPGIGSLMDPEKLSPLAKLAKKGLDLSAAFGLREKVIEGTRFLAENFEPGDRIILFGFSRGAYTARAVAGMIHMFGLPRREHTNLLPYMWERFVNNEAAPGSPDASQLFETAAKFKKYFGAPSQPKFDFVGLFDSVSSFGFLGMYRTLAFTRANPDIRILRQAAAIDERRAHFPLNAVEQGPGQDYRTVWFSGVHSDIGGGQADSKSALAKVTLVWMLEECRQNGIHVDEAMAAHVLMKPAPNPLYPRDESLVWYWRVLGLMPLRAWDQQRKRFALYWPNFQRIRPITPGEFVHDTVFDRMKADSSYRPKNLPESCRIVSERGISGELLTKDILSTWDTCRPRQHIAT